VSFPVVIDFGGSAIVSLCKSVVAAVLIAMPERDRDDFDVVKVVYPQQLRRVRGTIIETEPMTGPCLLPEGTGRRSGPTRSHVVRCTRKIATNVLRTSWLSLLRLIVASGETVYGFAQFWHVRVAVGWCLSRV